MNSAYVVKYLSDNVNTFSFSKELKVNTNVIVETDKGEFFGKVLKKYSNEIDLDRFPKIIREASAEDVDRHNAEFNKNKKILESAKENAKSLNLNMSIISAELSFDRRYLIIKFIADSRVDFRELAKRLGYTFKVRVELRQIGARDRSKSASGCGPCGQKLCCSRYLSEMDSVSMNMAKNQNLALNPSKINGCCNRLKCCLAYEDDVYSENRTQLPQIGEIIKYNSKEYSVKSLDLLRKKIIIYINKEKVELNTNEID